MPVILDSRVLIYCAAKNYFRNAKCTLVFQTRHANSAQPVVVFEPIARGVDIFPYARGWIFSAIETRGAFFAGGKNVTALALNWLRTRRSPPSNVMKVGRGTQTSIPKYRADSPQTPAMRFNVPPLHSCP